MRAAIETRDLRREFGSVTAVDALSLEVRPGEVFGLLGPNGAGKTTTIKMLITLLPPTSGSATVAGHDIAHEARAVRRSIGYVPQLLSSDGALSARENLDISGHLYHIPEPGAPRADRRGAPVHGADRRRGQPGADLLGRNGPPPRDRPGDAPRAARALPGRADGGAGPDRPARGLGARPEAARASRAPPSCSRRTTWTKPRSCASGSGSCISASSSRSGTPESLAAEVGPGASLDDVFTHFTGSDLDDAISWRYLS